MQRRFTLALTAAVLVACQSPTEKVRTVADVVPALPTYQWIPLDSRGAGFRSTAIAINDQNQVVGWAGDATGASHAVLWVGGVMLDLGTLGGATSAATAINQSGQVTGWSNTAANTTDAFFWDNGIIQDLGPVDFNLWKVIGGYPILLSPVHINDQGKVIGNRPGGGAFLWQAGNTETLPLEFATAINNRGQVAGWVMTPDLSGTLTRHAALWWAGGLTDLGTLGGTESWAVGINNSGQVLGTSETGLLPFRGMLVHQKHPFLWKDGVMQDLGNAIQCCETEWWAEFVNNSGQVTGLLPSQAIAGFWDNSTWQVLPPGGPPYGGNWIMAMNDQGTFTGIEGSFAVGRGFVWQGGVKQQLGTGLGTYSRGQAINDGGIVVGHTGVPSSYEAAAMWVPAPTSLLVSVP
jgi:probable HAF family extracellular repeat protein